MAQKEAIRTNQTKPKQLSTSKLKRTFSLKRIEEMEQKFQSLKCLYHSNLQSFTEKIKTELENNTTNDQKQPQNTRTEKAESDALFDDEHTLKLKIQKLAKLIQKSHHFVAFTGQGISRKTNPIKAVPTLSHMALVALMQNNPNYLKYIITHNTDSLHLKSGICTQNLCEMYGNVCTETCTRCGKVYMRDYVCRGSQRKPLTSHDHFTGRYCTVHKCNGQLKDTVINSEETPKENVLKLALEQSDKADLFLCLGSDLKTSPASDMPEIVGNKWNYEVNNEMDQSETMHDLVIVNTERTELDNICSLRLYASADTVMMGLMRELEMDIPKWYLQRFVRISVSDLENRGDLRQLSVSGVDRNGNAFSIFTDVRLSNNGKKIAKCDSILGLCKGHKRRVSMDNLLVLGKNVRKKMNTNNRAKKREEFRFNIPTISIFDNLYGHDINNEIKSENDKGLELEMMFYGHYSEERLVMELNEYLCHLSEENGCVVVKIVFDNVLKQWNVGDKREQLSDESVNSLWVGYDEIMNKNGKNEPLPNPYELRNDD